MLPPAAGVIAVNAGGVIGAIRARAPGLRITLDPVEFRGFRYHVGVAFTLYGPGASGEMARGGRYVSQNDEPATGMTLYPDAVLRAAAAAPARSRVFLPLGTASGEAARALRAEGHATVAALSPTDTAQSLRCTHLLRDGKVVPLAADAAP